MSYWTYLTGTITVGVMGRTQAEKRYILDTVLDHLPRVTGSEGDMDIYVTQKNGHNEYILTIDGALRDRKFEQTYREFIKWLVRLGKRVRIGHILVEVEGYGKSTIVTDRYIQNEKYSHMKVFENLFEDPSWSNETGEVNWAEYLMWDRAKDSSYPLLLAYKYFRDKENDKEAERRLSYSWGES